MKRYFKYSLLAITLFVMASCSAPKDVAYFQDAQETIVQTTTPQQIKIEPGDRLSIVVKSKDPRLSALFNLNVYTDRLMADNPTSSTGTTSVPANNTTADGISKYTVTPEGTIDFPLLGSIKVEGMTRSELAAFIKGDLIGKELVKDPIVTVEFLNMGISVMGEVARPGRYNLNSDALNVLEALSLAGDLTIQGKRENITVLREDSEGLHSYRIDLTNLKETAQSPAYYLKQGDIIYVEPNDIRKRQTTTNGNNVLSTGFWISVASLLTSVLTTVAVFIRK